MTKIDQIRESIQEQLGNFVATDNVKIPLQLILDNESVEAMNVFPVESKSEAEKIALELVGNTNILDRTKNSNEPLYLTVVATLPNPNLQF